MEGPTVTESGPNLDHSYQEGAGRCEVNFGSEMSSSHTDEGGQSDPPQALPGGNTSFRGPSNEAPVCSQHAERVGDDTESPSKHFTVEQNAEQANQVISTKTGNSCPPNEFLKDPPEKDGGLDPGRDADGHELARSSTTGNLEPIITVTHHELACLSDEEDSRETALAIYSNEPKVSCPSSKQEDLGKEAEPDRHKSESSGDSTPMLLDRSAREIEAKPNTKETPVEEKGSKEAESSEQNHAEPQREKITGVYDWNGQSHYTSISMESDMLSPVATPSGHHHHMQTQVSLETPACHSAATSPMTPPQGSGSYFFPYSFRKAGLNEGTQPPVYRSVATAPMSPLSPAVPESPCPEIKVIEARELTGCQGAEGTDDQLGAKKLPGYGKVSDREVDGSADRASRGEAIRVNSLLPMESVNKIQKDTPSVDSTPSSVSGSGTTPGTVTSNGVLDQTFKPRIDAGTWETAASQTNQSTGSSVICENNSKKEVVPQSTMPNEDIHDTQDSVPKCGTQPTVASEAMIQEHASRGRSVLAETRQVTLAVLSHDGGQSHDAPIETDLLSPVATPSGHHHHMQTQVSLEKPSCHSAATSPMTPPQGSGSYFFPYSFRKAGLNEGTQPPVYRSVATAPMSPLSPAVPESPCPEIKVTAAAGALEVMGLQGTEGEDRDAELAEVKACDDQQESVQDVRWDDRGMTWEVYGAAVEVDVLGTAIQKHLEKQGEEPGKQPPPLSPPVSPPLSPPPPPPNSATIPAPCDPPSSPSPPPHPPTPPSPPTQTPPPPVSAPSSSSSAEGEPVACDAGVVEEVVIAQESGEAEEVGVAGAEQGQEGKKGKRRRRNPFRTVLRNIRRPRCCSRTHTIE